MTVFPLPAGTYRQSQGLHGVDHAYDYACKPGTTVMANDNATVLIARDLGNTSYGKYVKLSNQSIYAHLSQIEVTAGQKVVAGQEIGKSGYSGNVRPPGPAGAHLHYAPGSAGLGGTVVQSPITGGAPTAQPVAITGLSDPQLWIRLLEIVLGLALIILALIRLTAIGSAISTGAKAYKDIKNITSLKGVVNGTA